MLSLTDRANQLNANLASTSESVVKGNKALMSERAQFHSKYASLTKKLEATQAALAEAEALPKEAIKNANLLNTKILELQQENVQLTQARAELEKALSDKHAELTEATAAASVAVDADLEFADVHELRELDAADHGVHLPHRLVSARDLALAAHEHQRRAG